MSDFAQTYEVVKDNEGGYNRPNQAGLQGRCGVGSGETYKGIDRNCFPTWPGWKIIDAYKAQNGTPAEESIIQDPQLDFLCTQWFLEFLSKMIAIQNISNQTLSNLVADFLLHKQYDAIKVINYTAVQVARAINYTGVVSTQVYSVDNSIVQLMNTRPDVFYVYLKSYRIQYYQTPAMFGSNYKFSPALVASFINRVNKFPPTI